MSIKPVVSGLHADPSPIIIVAFGFAGFAVAEPAALPAGMCPLNSGGPSLLGTSWRLTTIYGNAVLLKSPLR